MGITTGIYQRTGLLLGDAMMQKLSETKVIIMGVGGVGSWCAESLVRTGITNITLVDSDRVCVTNINRQLHATTKTIGKVKVEVLKSRLLEINPKADITAIQEIYCKATDHLFDFNEFDYVIDAIDSLSNKIHLIRTVTRSSATMFCSMGASLKLDPSRIKVAEFWKVDGCPLGSKVRKRIRRGELPAKEFLCVYSDEVLDNLGQGHSCGSVQCLCPVTKSESAKPELDDHEWCSKKAVINGTVAHMTAIIGFTLAGLVIQDLNGKKS